MPPKINDGLTKARRYKLRHPERVKAQKRAWEKANPERVRAQRSRSGKRTYQARTREARYIRKYGITLEQYDAMWAAQGGVCAICGLLETQLTRGGSPRRLSVDHHHESGAVRALLCAQCNQGLGNFRENPDALVRAAAYLSDWAGKGR